MEAGRFGVAPESFKRQLSKSLKTQVDAIEEEMADEKAKDDVKINDSDLTSDYDPDATESKDEMKDQWEVQLTDSETQVDAIAKDLMHKEKNDPRQGRNKFMRKTSLLPSLTQVLNIPEQLRHSDARSESLGDEVDAMNEKRKQFHHRILNVMKSCYSQSYEEGVISQSAAKALQDAVEMALDYDDISLQYEYLLGFFKISKFFQRWYSCGITGKLPLTQTVTKYLLLNKLSIAVEVGTVFIHSVKKLKVVLTDVPEISNSPLCRDVLETLQKHSDDIREEWLGIQESYPSLYKAIQTRHAVQHVIHSEAEAIMELKLHGLLDDTEHERMMTELMAAQHKLGFAMFGNVSIEAQKVDSAAAAVLQQNLSEAVPPQNGSPPTARRALLQEPPGTALRDGRRCARHLHFGARHGVHHRFG